LAAPSSRSYVYGLAVASGVGVSAVFGILSDETRKTLMLTGVRSVCDLGREHPIEPGQPWGG
jgi:isopentenyl diphosphate isomerase/L-lactate dehydrogenase-like FMN-dependent dehydrogenase